MFVGSFLGDKFCIKNKCLKYVCGMIFRGIKKCMALNFDYVVRAIFYPLKYDPKKSLLKILFLDAFYQINCCQ
jgi:hypothetical protein